MVAIWVVKAGVSGKYSGEMRARGIAAYDAHKVQEDVKDIDRVEDLAQRLFKAEMRKQIDNEEATWLTCLNVWGPQLWAFIHEIKESDWIVMPTGRKGTAYAFGQVRDSYRYDTELPEVMAHARDVAWRRDDVHASALGRERVTSIHEQSRTVYRPSAQQALITFTQGLPTG
ncbi:hypothetical protein [Streptomyces sp. NBC_01244]|uniref:hypothetical protein n=1 Tax=Streptomyces sp. NBC_01244 TaxID=2903797 RepID=UPI002E0DD29D|nr:hypothetical protein OG247_31295 [Streptomyces sp. NBC_01244]